MSLMISPFKTGSKPDPIPGLLALLSRYGVRVYLRDGRLKAKRPWPSWEDAPGPVRYALRWLKARRNELEAYLREQAERDLMDNLYSWTLPCTEEEERRVKAAFEQENGNPPVPIPERKRSTWLDKWPPLSDLISRLEAAGFKLELDGDLLQITPPAPAEELPPELLELWNQVAARAKAIALHLKGKQHRESVRQNCWTYLPEGPDPMDFRFNVKRQEWVYEPGWWKGVLH